MPVANSVRRHHEASSGGTISGSAAIGSTLTASSGSSYQWRRGGSNISSATNQTYVSTGDDFGLAVDCVISGTASSNSITPIYDFTVSASTLPNGTSLTRATTTNGASHFDSSGVLTFNATADTPRWDYKYDGSGWNLAGLLVEDASSGLLNHSNMDSNWTPEFTTLSTNSVTSPDGTGDGAKLTASTTNIKNHDIYQGSESGKNVTGTMSAILRADGYNFGVLQFATTGAGNGVWAMFNLSIGAYDSSGKYGTGSTPTYGIQNLSGGWYRCWTTGLQNTSSNTYPVVAICNSTGNYTNAWAGDGTKGIDICYINFEQKSYPSSITKSTTAYISRPADVLSLNIPSATNIQLTYDDASTQTIAVSAITHVSGTTYSLIAANLNRPWVKTIAAA